MDVYGAPLKDKIRPNGFNSNAFRRYDPSAMLIVEIPDWPGVNPSEYPSKVFDRMGPDQKAEAVDVQANCGNSS